MLAINQSQNTVASAKLGFVAQSSEFHGLETARSAFLDDVRTQFETPVTTSRLLDAATKLCQSYQEHSTTETETFLPSFMSSLPTGTEQGIIIAVDVGGSTLRAANVALEGSSKLPLLENLESWPIKHGTKSLAGDELIKWFTSNICKLLTEARGQTEDLQPDCMSSRMACPPSIRLGGDIILDSMASRVSQLDWIEDSNRPRVDLMKAPSTQMALAWSFPIQQNNLSSGLIQALGKGFAGSSDLEGKDLGKLFQDSFTSIGNDVRVNAIVNDTIANFMAQSYVDPNTHFSIVLGTGFNAAIQVPISSLSPAKYGDRKPNWSAGSKDVLLNTELSMFGKNILPTTPWDHALNAAQSRPDFQPFEYRCSGLYLPELVRLILFQAIEEGTVFDGMIPLGLDQRFNFEGSLMAKFEVADNEEGIDSACAAILQAHPLPSGRSITKEEARFISQICKIVSRRGAILVALGVFSLWLLRREHYGLEINAVDPSCPQISTVVFTGSVLEKYPGFQKTCQDYCTQLIQLASGGRYDVILKHGVESSLVGAAVAAACTL